MGANNGSYYESHKYGTAAWCIADSKYKKLSQGTCAVPGVGDIHRSFRSELVGILAILTFIDSLDLNAECQTSHIHIIGDNEKALEALETWTVDKVTPNKKNADIVSAVLKLRDSLPITISTEHVYSHQDEAIPYDKLPPSVQLNIDMDKNAKGFALQMINSSRPQYACTNHYASLPTCKWRDQIILQKTFNNLYYLMSHNKLVQYWTHTKKILPTEQLPNINFHALSKGMKALPTNMRRFIAKWSYDCPATGKNMVRWKMRHEGYCPFCTHPNKTTSHILECTHIDSLLHWQEVINNYFKNLLKIGTCPTIIMALKHELHLWRYNKLPSIQPFPTLLQHAILEQRQIGWKNFLEGFVSTKWETYMAKHYKSVNSKQKAPTWASKLITYGIKALFNIWDNQNQQLHKTAQIHNMEGIPILLNSIKKEWNVGIGRLPASEYSQYLSVPINTILAKSHEWQKHWFMMVRQARILLDNTNLIDDEFSISSTLQKWIGISYSLNDSEAIPLLHQSIKQELQIGLSTLPHNPFYSYFQLSFDNLIEQSSLPQLKSWLKTIKQG